MKYFLSLITITLLPAFSALAEDRIDPDGIPGAVILSAADDETGPFLNLIRRQFQSDGLTTLIVVTSAEQKTHAELIAEHRKAWKIGPKITIRVMNPTAESLLFDDAEDDLPTTLVHLSKLDALKDDAAAVLRTQLTEALANSAAVCATGNDLIRLDELNVIPDVHLRRETHPAKKVDPAKIDILLPNDELLLIAGRRIFALAGKPRIRLAKGAGFEAVDIRLSEKSPVADLTALRRSLRERKADTFSPVQGSRPYVPNGTLIIIGGGGTPPEAMRLFAKGKRAEHLIAFPTANPDPIPLSRRSSRWFQQAGFNKVTVLDDRRLEKVESEEYHAAMKSATAIWFGGGRQWRFYDAYEGTKLLELMREVLKRGGVIAGSSAGASIQGEYLARANPLGNLDIMADGYERGLNFLPGVAIDQHFTQRGRQPDLESLVDRYQKLLGIGIDESTAIVVQKQFADVIGRYRVQFFHYRNGQRIRHVLSKGGRYDMERREIVKRGYVRAPRP